MRLKESEVLAIKRSFGAVFNEGTVSLFGSRTDDTKKGGDIDLFLEVRNSSDQFLKRYGSWPCSKGR